MSPLGMLHDPILHSQHRAGQRAAHRHAAFNAPGRAKESRTRLEVGPFHQHISLNAACCRGVLVASGLCDGPGVRSQRVGCKGVALAEVLDGAYENSSVYCTRPILHAALVAEIGFAARGPENAFGAGGRLKSVLARASAPDRIPVRSTDTLCCFPSFRLPSVRCWTTELTLRS